MMPDRIASGGDPNDTRFQFEIIKGLSESIRQQSTSIERLAVGMADMQKTQVGMLERLAKLEANRVAEVVAEVRVDVSTLESTVKSLVADQNRREGAIGLLGAVRSWWPAIVGIASLFSALWLAGRSIGVVPAPPVQVPVQITRELQNAAEGKR